MPPSEDEFVTIKMSDIKVLERLAVEEARLGILAEDFQRHRTLSEKQLTDINANIGKIYDLERALPDRISDCQEKMELDIEKKYMTKQDGLMLEQHLAHNIRSVKMWIVSSVSGATATGVFIMWFFNLTGHSIS